METDAAIQVDKLSKAFEGRQVLKEVSFRVPPGEAFGILGKSGMGKSVTLKLIVGLMPPDSGSTFIGGEEVQKLEREDLMRVRKTVGFMFQDAALFDSVSVFDNVAFPLRRHTTKSEAEIAGIVHQRLAEVDLGQHADKMPSDLSGGMRKRAGLARALALDPPILLVDEPNSGLDPVTAAEVYTLLAGLKRHRGTTLLLVTHDAAGVRSFADRLGVLDEGRLIACGTPDELAHSKEELVRVLAGGAGGRDG